MLRIAVQAKGVFLKSPWHFSGSTDWLFFNHMLEQIGKHAAVDLDIVVKGDWEVDEHHKIEGIFKAWARALKMAVKRDIYHYELPSSKGVL